MPNRRTAGATANVRYFRFVRHDAPQQHAATRVDQSERARER